MRALIDGLQLGAFLIVSGAIVIALMSAAVAIALLLYGTRNRTVARQRGSTLTGDDPTGKHEQLGPPVGQT